MSTPPPAGRRPHDAAGWFDGWSEYAAIVASDLLRHRGVFQAIREWAFLCRPGPFSLADLGSGDSGFIAGAFADTGLWSYTGIDMSRRALERAAEHLAGARFRVRLVEADMLEWLRRTADGDGEIDVLLSLYSVHHLPSEGKRTFLALAAARLPPGGVLLFGDLFRRGEESRETWLGAFLEFLGGEWRGMPLSALANTTAHVTAHDYPETLDGLRAMAAEAGFEAAPRELFCDASGFYRLLAFTKARGMAPSRSL